MIATGTRFEGTLLGKSDVLVEGELVGDAKLDAHLTIGPGGRAEGALEATAVRIAGKVVGNVRGRERVEILPSGALEGDVSAAKFVIAEGAFFKGRVEMGDGEREVGEKKAGNEAKKGA
ncbi:MAG: polymer-forming cytoskeletal protein [Thermoanaerobaculia bacterium]